ncbi:MAG TPA: CNNM domain-containing protein, partial [Phycisphaeraceae bacterium]
MNAAILIALAACALSCYFAACQIALKTFSRKRLAEFLAQRGREHQLEPFVEHLPQLLLLTGTLRTSFNLIVLLAVLYFVQTRFNFSDWGWLSGYEWLAYYLISFLITGVLVSIFGVAIAVSLARYSREPLLGRSIPLFNVVLVVLKPLASFLHLFDPLVRRLSGADLTRSEDHPLTDQVLSVVEEHEHDVGQVVDEAQKEMLEAVFELPTTSAGEIMTPRTEVRGIEVGASLEEVKRAIQEYGYSRIPVYQENLDNIVGILYTKDLIRFLGDGDPFDLRAVLREPFMVPESKSVRELLA